MKKADTINEILKSYGSNEDFPGKDEIWDKVSRLPMQEPERRRSGIPKGRIVLIAAIIALISVTTVFAEEIQGVIAHLSSQRVSVTEYADIETFGDIPAYAQDDKPVTRGTLFFSGEETEDLLRLTEEDMKDIKSMELITFDTLDELQDCLDFPLPQFEVPEGYTFASATARQLSNDRFLNGCTLFFEDKINWTTTLDISRVAPDCEIEAEFASSKYTIDNFELLTIYDGDKKYDAVYSRVFGLVWTDGEYGYMLDVSAESPQQRRARALEFANAIYSQD